MQRFIPERKLPLVLFVLIVGLMGIATLATSYEVGFQLRSFQLNYDFAPGTTIEHSFLKDLKRNNARLAAEEVELKSAQELVHVAFPQPTTDVGPSSPPCATIGCDGLVCFPRLQKDCSGGVCKPVELTKVEHLRTVDEEHDGANINWDRVETMTVHYEGWRVKTGEKIDSSYDRGAPTTFKPSRVIKGFAEGAKSLKRNGDKVRVLMDESLGYPNRANLDGDLIFDIELVAVEYKTIKALDDHSEGCLH